MVSPEAIHLIGDQVAIRWSDGEESFYGMEMLRAHSPSAENVGERDLTGVIHGGSTQTSFPGVLVTGWQPVGGYAIQFEFSDGHRTGLFGFDYLRELSSEA
jgi:DUF971 family protein